MKNPATELVAGFKGGGDEGNRTPDLLNAIQALSQLSYIPKPEWKLVLCPQVAPHSEQHK